MDLRPKIKDAAQEIKNFRKIQIIVAKPIGQNHCGS